MSPKSTFKLELLPSQSFTVEQPLLVDSDMAISGGGYFKVDVVIKLFELGECHFPPLQLAVTGSYVRIKQCHKLYVCILKS